MHTVMVMAGGFALLAAIYLLSKALRFSVAKALLVYVVLWFCVASYNMWYGVNHAGYSYQDELPIFIAIFAIPAAVALLIRWKFA